MFKLLPDYRLQHDMLRTLLQVFQELEILGFLERAYYQVVNDSESVLTNEIKRVGHL